MSRVYVPVDDDVRSEVNERPDDLALDPNLSEAQRFAELVDEGIRARRALVRNQRRADSYSEHSTDAEYLESVQRAADAAFDDGGF